MSSKTDFHLDRVYGYLRIVLAFIVLLLSWLYFSAAMDYRPNASRVYIDMLERPMPAQNLTGFATHNHNYGKGRDSVKDFAEEFMLTMFTYSFDELESGIHKQKVMPFISAKVFKEIYTSFYGLTYNKVVLAQKGIVEAFVPGEIEFVGGTNNFAYQGNSNEVVRTYQVKGRLVVDLTANDSGKDFYQFVIYVQRAPVQDKSRGYQVIQLEISS